MYYVTIIVIENLNLLFIGTFTSPTFVILLYLPTVLICWGKAGRLLCRGGITGCWLAATVHGAEPWILLLWWLLLLLLLLLLLVAACRGGGTVAAGWLTCRRLRRVTSSVLKLRRRCCRCTASFDDDASDNKMYTTISVHSDTYFWEEQKIWDKFSQLSVLRELRTRQMYWVIIH